MDVDWDQLFLGSLSCYVQALTCVQKQLLSQHVATAASILEHAEPAAIVSKHLILDIRMAGLVCSTSLASVATC